MSPGRDNHGPDHPGGGGGGFPFELVVFLSGTAMLLASLVVLYLYLNRRLCFSGHDKRKFSDYSNNTIGDDTFCYYEDLSASSDSDEHLLNENERTASVCSGDDRKESHPFTELNANFNYSSCAQTQLTTPAGATAASTATASKQEATAAAAAAATTTTTTPAAPSGDGGFLEVNFNHDPLARRIVVSLAKARKLPTKTQGGANSCRVKVTAILPKENSTSSNKLKHTSKVRQADQQGNCSFNEDLVFSRISCEVLSHIHLRFRIYSAQERLRRRRLISYSISKAVVQAANVRPEDSQNSQIDAVILGETTVALSPAHLKENLTLALKAVATITSDSEQSDSSSGSTNSLNHVGLSSSPELLIGLAYNGTTGRLSVEVIGGSHLGVLPGVPHVKSCATPDTFVKLSLISSSGQEIANSKTSVRRNQADPVFKETFLFQVALFQLTDVTLVLSAYKRSSMKRKQLVGWVSFGLNASSDTQLVHWDDMRDGKGDQVARWSTLIQQQS